MNKKLRTNVPISREARKQAVSDRELLITREEELRRVQKNHFDCHHRDRDLSSVLPGNLARIPDRSERGTVRVQAGPRSYRVHTPSGNFRRNRRDIISIPGEEVPSRGSESQDTKEEIDTVANDSSPHGSPTLRRSRCITYNLDQCDPCAR